MDISAQTIAEALGGSRIGLDRYMACCPAHNDKNPSFSFTQQGDKLLVHCFAGCSQAEVIEALRGLGLWPEKRVAKLVPMISRAEMAQFCVAHEVSLRYNIPTSTKAKVLYSQYRRVLDSPFTSGELVEMHLFCLLYKADRHYGKPSTPLDDRKFRAFSSLIYQKGVPYDCR